MSTATIPAALLAKTPKEQNRPSRPETLVGHIDNVYRVSATVVDNIGTNIFGSLEVAPARLEWLNQAMCLASHLHDLGKANSHFQRALSSGNQFPQALRHEWISTWLPLKFPELDRWLFAGYQEEIRQAVLFSVLGHHLKFESGAALQAQPGTGETTVTVFCDHPDFRSCLRSLASHQKKTVTEPIPVLPDIQIDLLDQPLAELRYWLPEANEWYLRANHDIRRLIALIKALLIASDVAGLAVPRTGVDPAEWTESVLNRVCLAEDLNNIAESGLKGHVPREFQMRIADSTGQVVFTKAGCGSGKTIAAYLWAARRAKGRKLFFCYPTTGTATEGFRDYIIPAEMSADAALLHSRSECDLEYLLNAEEDGLEASSRIESLTAWDVPLIVCTVDQVLGLIQNNRKPLFSFPSIGNGTFVFDEVHQYDDRLFGALLSFLDIFRGAPALLMTASLPKARLEAIKQLLLRRGATLEIIEGPADLERIPRYILTGPVESPPWAMVSENIEHGGNILWVANTVERCMRFVKEAEEHGIKPLPYHSRYRYCDRIEKHNAVIQAFKAKRGILVITTQVCEVSLDISADLLVTDLAPTPALIQRLGRLNRRVTSQKPGSPKFAILLIPESERPYQKTDLDAAREWLRRLGTGPLSQATLATAFENSGDVPALSVRSAWLDGGPFSKQQPLRDADMTIPVVRAEDEALCLDNQSRPIMKEVTHFTIPMLLGPVAKEINSWRRLSFVFVAPKGRIDYSKELGAKWVK